MGITRGEIVQPDEANGHDLRTNVARSSDGWIWCTNCGSHSQQRICGLASPCKGIQNTAQKRRLETGKHPYTLEIQGHDVIPLASNVWGKGSYS